MKVEVFGLTDKGMVRELNEDNFIIHGFDDDRPQGLCIITDGMGGHNAGEIASKKAIDFILDRLSEELNELDNEKIVENIMDAVGIANSKVYERSITNSDQHGMGTTVVMTYVLGNNVWVANIGDSRAYLIRDGQAKQITVDHSVVQEMVDRGTITKEDAINHPQKNIITRALGTEKSVKTDLFLLKHKPDDIILMCSDGLTEMLRDNEIRDIILSADSINVAVEELIKKANENGGMDNVTAICIKFS